MKTPSNYQEVRVSPNISKSKLKKALTGGSLTLSRDDLQGNQTLLLHPSNAVKVIAAQKAGKCVRLPITHGEIAHDLNHRQGASLWESIKSGLSSLWNTVGKPIASAALDGIANAAQTAGDQLIPGLNIGSTLAPSLRQGVKDLTGVGFSKPTKGSQAAKDRMARVRAAKSSRRAGSFRLN
ncbi:hypothetical protein AC1031_002417 [Aphanomyces cochlioides]|nr:hypothetical protein AC1031_002417 [Aphanomyces cochlioides]